MSAGGIVDLSREQPAGPLTVEVCVIGSGCGGATAAWDLARAGKEVLVLEEGSDFTGPQLTGRDGEMYDQLYMDRGGRATDDLAINVLQGRVLGGGGVINACDVVPFNEQVLDLWVRRHGLTDLSPAAMAPYTTRALADLSASPMGEGDMNRANQLLARGAARLGLAGGPMQHNRVGCAELGTCLIGCPVDAKKNPRFVALPAALEAGARVLTRARAVRILDGDQEFKRVVVHRLDPRGYRETGRLEVRARVVVVAANAVATPQLLLRSGLGNEHVGRHLSLQPQLPIMALFDERVDAFRGIPQVWAVTEGEGFDPDHGLSGFRIEAIMGTPGIVGSLVPFTGHEGKAMMARYAHVAASLLLVPDRPSGRVTLHKDGRPRIRYEHHPEHKARVRAALRMAARAYLAAGAQEVMVPVVPPVRITREAHLARLDGLDFPAATAPFLSAHQQGTVRMAPSARDGACDPEGRLYGARDVLVFDSSPFPTSASSHTMAPIIALSHALSDRLLARMTQA